MALTPEQTTSVTTALSVDLSLQTVDRLIELCLLHKAAPDTYPQFVDLLKIEIDRRFTSVEIEADDVMFSVLNNFYNGFKSNIPYYARKMQEMSSSANRDIWFTDNTALMTSFADDIEAMEWLILPEQETILTRILNNALGIMFLGNSVVSATAILTNSSATNIWKNSPFTRIHWPLCKNGMDVVHKSEELINYYIDEMPGENRQFLINVYNSTAAMESLISTRFAIEKYCLRGDVVYPLQVNYSIAMTALASSNAAMNIIAASSVAMTALAASSTAMNIIIASSTAMNIVIESSTAMNKIAASGTAMDIVIANSSVMYKIAASSVAMAEVAESGTAMARIAASNVAMNTFVTSSIALSAIVKSTPARNALISNNSSFQSKRTVIYNTVKANWTKHAGVTQVVSADLPMANINAAVASPAGIVLATLGSYGSSTQTRMLHPGGTFGAAGGSTYNPSSLSSIDAVSFNGAQFFAAQGAAKGFVELWKPPT